MPQVPAQPMGTSADGGNFVSFVRRKGAYLLTIFVVLAVHFPQLFGWFQMDDFFHYHHLERQQSAWEFWTTPAKELDRFWFAAPDSLGQPPMDHVLYLRPLPTLWHKLDLSLFGDRAFAPKAENLLLHLLNVFLFLGLLRRLYQPGALPIALAFAVHPLSVEPIGWISSRNDLLILFCMLLAAWGFVLSHHHSKEQLPAHRKRLAILGMVLALWAGLLSKESAVMGVAAALIFGLWIEKRRFFKRIWPYTLVVGTVSWIAYWLAMHPDNAVSMSKANLGVFLQHGPLRVLGFQFFASLFSMGTGLAPPSFMHFDLSSSDWKFFLVLFLIGCLVVCLVRARANRTTYACLLLGLFMLPSLAMHSAPRYLYFCLPAFFAFVGTWIWKTGTKRPLIRPLFVAMILLWSVASHILTWHGTQGSRWIRHDLESVREAVSGENVKILYLVDWWPLAINSELWLPKILEQPDARIRLLNISPSIHRPELITIGLWVAWLWSYPTGIPYDEERYNCLEILDDTILLSRTVPEGASLAALFDVETVCKYWPSNKVIRAPDVTVEFRGPKKSGCPNRMSFILPAKLDAPGIFVLRRTPEGFRRIQQDENGHWDLYNPPQCPQTRLAP